MIPKSLPGERKEGGEGGERRGRGEEGGRGRRGREEEGGGGRRKEGEGGGRRGREEEGGRGRRKEGEGSFHSTVHILSHVYMSQWVSLASMKLIINNILDY